MNKNTRETLSIVRDCVQHHGFTQLLTLQIQQKMNDEQRSIVIDDINQLLINPEE